MRNKGTWISVIGGKASQVIFRTRSSQRGWMHSSTFHRDFAYVAPDAAQLLPTT